MALRGNYFPPTFAKQSFERVGLKEAETNYWQLFAETIRVQTQSIVFKGISGN